ncbi:hypothetical protein OG194_29550 [Streptomyces sp. NBC_01288]|uniref:hypothetical protein n=1 Tax=Streptomyces sp. NBC_01288 TaxID=2903814 RepID=UPI002E0E6375|nr:hypothetical protein OG194_29550 [Streptomyces sp. NBC_01288]
MDFTTPVPIGTATSPLYQVTVNDNGQDGGSTTQLVVSGFPPAADLTAADTAVRALAEAYAAAADYQVVSISRITVTSADL